MTIRELMDSGRLYAATGEGFPEEQLRCKELVYEFNRAHPRDEETRQKILRELLGDMGETVWIEPPFHLEFGYRTHIGSFFYANFNLVIVDDVDVYIGDYVMIAPNVTITATGHPVHPDLRIHGEQFSLPVHIQDQQQCCHPARCYHWKKFRHRSRQRGNSRYPSGCCGCGQPLPGSSSHHPAGQGILLQKPPGQRLNPA